MFFGGGALALSACFGCLFTLDMARGAALEGIPVVLAVLVFGGLVGSAVGALFLLMRMLRALFRKKDRASS